MKSIVKIWFWSFAAAVATVIVLRYLHWLD